MIKKNEPKMNKSAFVRAQPASLSTKEVVAKARAEGLVLTEQNVWATRYAMKMGKRKTKARATGAAIRMVASTQSATTKGSSSATKSSDGTESQFLSLVLDLGLVRSSALLSDARRRLSSLALD